MYPLGPLDTSGTRKVDGEIKIMAIYPYPMFSLMWDSEYLVFKHSWYPLNYWAFFKGKKRIKKRGLLMFSYKQYLKKPSINLVYSKIVHFENLKLYVTTTHKFIQNFTFCA